MNLHRFARRLAAAGLLGSLATPVAAAEPPAPAPVVLERVVVLGSHIRRVDTDGPSPVSVYDRELIAASGAQRVADFLNLLPQNYTGASSGRGSAPNDFNPEFGLRTETSSPLFNFILGAADVPLGQSGVSGANLRGLGSGSTLVLIDGRRQPIAGQGNRSTDTRQGFVDLNTIALGMVERIEVLTGGASALYGSDAIGGVINIVLKKNYSGAELTTRYGGTFEGGASERQATLNAGFTSHDAKLRGSLSLDASERGKLTAAQRAFSREQNRRDVVIGHTQDGAPISGADFRLNWGYPAVVQARTGTLNGVTEPDGTAVAAALVPDGALTTPSPAEFIPGRVVPPATAILASGQQRTNTAAFLALVPPQETRSIGGSLEYDFNPGLRGYARASLGRVTAQFDAQPPVSTASASAGFGNFSTIVPAIIDGQPNALNPFGQDVLVGLIHHEFGATRQTTRTLSHSAMAGLAGVVAERWTWDANVSWARQRFAQRNVTLDLTRFTAALAASDLTQRFNPFVDARVAGPVNAALYEAMTAIAAFDGTSELAAGSVVVNGLLFALPGGELQMAAGGEFSISRHEAVSSPITGMPVAVRSRRKSHAAFVELLVPLVGAGNARPLIRRLDVQLAGRHENHGSAGHTTDPRIGIVWSPVQSLLLRGSTSTGFRAPALTEYEAAVTSSTQTLTDPRRTPASTSGVSITRGSNAGIQPETSRSDGCGLMFTPSFVEGLSLEIDYYRTRQRNAIQVLTPQMILRNEAMFPNRVVRREANADDNALNQPGAIISVDGTFANFGEVRNESVDFRLNHDLPWRRLGRLRLSVSASRTLEASAALSPGTAPVALLGDTAAPPRWRWMGTAQWSRDNWAAAMFVMRVGAFASNHAGNMLASEGYPASTTVTLTGSYRFTAGLWRGKGKGMRLGLGVGNVFDRNPPFSNTVFGFNGGLHSALGRTYEVSLNVPF